MKRYLFIAGLAALVVLAIWDQWRRQTSVQIPATFARLAQGIADHNAADVMASVDRSYNFHLKWPELFADPSKARSDAQRLLALAFLHTGRDELAMQWALDGIQEQPDGSIRALVTLKVSGGPFTQAMPPLSRHTFMLRRSGWLSGHYRITDHAPFTLNVPSY